MAWREEAHSFESISPYWWSFEYLIRDDGSQFIQGLDVTTNYFDLIGIKPVLGQTFSPSAAATGDQRDCRDFAVRHRSRLANSGKKAFQGDPQIIGQAIHISRIEEPLTIVGVMPLRPASLAARKTTPAVNPTYDVNAPVDFVALSTVMVRESKLESTSNADVIAGRLRPGVTLGQAQAELAVIAGRHARIEGISERVKVKAGWLMALLNREGNRLLLPLMGAVALLFLIACGNVAGLLLGRGLKKQREYAVRCALGAGRAQLFSLAMAGPLVLSVLGGVLSEAAWRWPSSKSSRLSAALPFRAWIW